MFSPKNQGLIRNLKIIDNIRNNPHHLLTVGLIDYNNRHLPCFGYTDHNGYYLCHSFLNSFGYQMLIQVEPIQLMMNY